MGIDTDSRKAYKSYIALDRRFKLAYIFKEIFEGRRLIIKNVFIKRALIMSILIGYLLFTSVKLTNVSWTSFADTLDFSSVQIENNIDPERLSEDLKERDSTVWQIIAERNQLANLKLTIQERHIEVDQLNKEKESLINLDSKLRHLYDFLYNNRTINERCQHCGDYIPVVIGTQKEYMIGVSQGLSLVEL